MKKNSIALLVNIHLPKKFIEKIRSEMDKEIESASDKYDFFIDSVKRSIIIDNSLEQLQRKTLEIFKVEWDLSDIIHIKVNSDVSSEIDLPNEKAKTSPIKFIRLTDAWELDNENRENTVMIKDFDKEIEKNLIEWGKTAVFYGVASYSKE